MQNVNTVYQSEATGPSAEFQFKRSSNSSVKVDFEKAKGWNVTIIPEHNKVHTTHEQNSIPCMIILYNSHVTNLHQHFL